MLPTSAQFRQSLLAAELLHESEVDGLYHRSGTFEGITSAVQQLASRAGSDLEAPVRFLPPVMPRSVFERTDYLRSFPDLVGSVDTFVGNDKDHADLLQIAEAGGDWTAVLTPAEVVLTPAVCHPLYPTLRGEIPYQGLVFEVNGYAFRHEPSLDPARMQSFRMHEFVHVGTPEGAVVHRDQWLQRGLDTLSGIGLQVEPVVANDPFFGRAGRMLAANQRETTLKYEIVAPITSDKLTAISSANYHEDHFGGSFLITTPDGQTAHSACFGFGLERVTLALLSRHGLDPATWPTYVRSRLWP